MMYRASKSTLILSMLLTLGCSEESSDTETPAAEDVVEDTQTGLPGVSCELACKRAPRCAEFSVTEADCLALCQQNEDPETYACCIQYASDCIRVASCIDGSNRTCQPEGSPWTPLEMFDECTCGDPNNPTPKIQECKSSAPDHPCPAGAVCLKAANQENAQCVIACTMMAEKCPEDMTCTTTPKTWYCKPKS